MTSTLDYQSIVDQIVSDALASGLFESVNAHEPKSSPGHGLTCAVWLQRMDPIRASGLNSTSGRLEIRVRLYTSMLAEPQDMIDPYLAEAAQVLLTRYTGNFELDIANCRGIDLLGAYGVPMSYLAGYINQDSKLLRIVDITMPIILNDLWDQAP